MATIELTRDQCDKLAEFIEFNLLDVIRKDSDIDNLYWVKCMLDVWERLKEGAEREQSNTDARGSGTRP